MSVSRRALLRLLATGTGAVVLAACGGTAAPSSAPSSQAPSSAAPASSAPPASAAGAAASAKPSAAVSVSGPTSAAAGASAQPKAGGTLKQGYAQEITDLDPHRKVGNDAIWVGVFERLTSYDNNLKPQPMLAESWDVTPDSKQVTLHLRKGVMWHSGRELNSDDVKFSVTRAADPKTASGQYAPMASWWTSIETPDKYTVVLKSDQSRPAAFDLFEYMNIVDPNSVADVKTKAVGTGPFTFVEWVPGDHVTLAKNKNYWQSGKPYLDQILIPIYRDQQAMSVALESGAIDIARNPTIQDFNRLKANNKFVASLDPLTGGVYEMGVNTTMPPFDKKEFRQALNYAIDRKRYVDTIEGGVGAPESLPWLQASPAYEANKANFYTYDLDKAKALLKQAGVSSLTMDFLPNPPNSSQTDGFGQIYQASLAQLGITLNIRDLDNATWLDLVNNRKYNGVYFASGTYFNLSPGTALTSGKAFAPSSNNSGFKTDQYVNLVAAATTETDPAKQKQIYSQLNDLILDESFAMLITQATGSTYIARSGVNNLVWTAHESPWYVDTWLA
ncbi:MAG: ABC transporter substrate-binding protein [Chloroflexi bacterium]|nr:ABC transporter substrate-binding protein [Chloroflexota bacterium]